MEEEGGGSWAADGGKIERESALPLSPFSPKRGAPGVPSFTHTFLRRVMEGARFWQTETTYLPIYAIEVRGKPSLLFPLHSVFKTGFTPSHLIIVKSEIFPYKLTSLAGKSPGGSCNLALDCQIRNSHF